MEQTSCVRVKKNGFHNLWKLQKNSWILTKESKEKREKITVGAAVEQKDFSNLLFKMLFYLRSAAKNSCVAYPSLQQTYVGSFK